MSFYDNMNLLAARLLVKFGTSASLTTSTRTFNKRLNRMEEESSTSTSCLAVVRPIEVTDEAGRLLMQTQAVLNKLPVEGGKLTMGDTTWTIGKVTVVKPIGDAIIYFAEVS